MDLMIVFAILIVALVLFVTELILIDVTALPIMVALVTTVTLILTELMSNDAIAALGAYGVEVSPSTSQPYMLGPTEAWGAFFAPPLPASAEPLD